MDNVDCIGCGKCCGNHWLVRLEGKRERELFPDSIVFGKYIWTDECPYLIEGKCTIQEEKPHKCREYFCEEHFKLGN